MTPRIPTPAPDWFRVDGHLRNSVARWLNQQGLRYCPACQSVKRTAEFNADLCRPPYNLDRYCKLCRPVKDQGWYGNSKRARSRRQPAIVSGAE